MIDYIRRYPVTLLVFLLFLINSGLVTSKQLNRRFYRFDAGPENSAVAGDYLLLTPGRRVDSESAVGWIRPPEDSFVRAELNRSRDAFTIDGVVGSSMELLVRLPAGKWWLTLWADAGMEDSSTVILEVAGKERTLNWHAFQPPAEPRANLQAIYRLYHGAAIASGDSLTISVSSSEEPVRLLGLTLTPDPQPVSAMQRDLLQQMISAGRYGDQTPLQTILDALQAESHDLSDPFYAYWTEQIGLLRGAEIHLEKRGWEDERRASGLGIFDRLHQAVMILDGLLNYEDAESNPFYERALSLRGRILYWLSEERGGPNEFAGGRRDLRKLYRSHPDDALLAMYNGDKIDLPDPCDSLIASPAAPEWSVAQRELLCRMREIAHWWVEEQQAPNGEFGGKIGDDVELLRWWMPLILAGDTLSLRGWRKLADGVLENSKVYKGYSREAIDVEHSSEFISDTAPGMVLYSDDPVYLERLRYSADYFLNLWTGLSQNGHRFFKSAWFSSTEVDETPPKNRDVEYNSRATKAVRYLAWKTGDPEVIKALHEWSLAWRDVAMATVKGKPRGLIPASVRFPDEAINGDGQNWYEADMYWDYFDWEHNAGGMLLDQMLFTYTLTKDDKLLDPLQATLLLVQSHEGGNGENAEPGSGTWAARILRGKSGVWNVAAQWRLLTGDTRFDDLLLKYGPPYLRYRLDGKESQLLDELKIALQDVRFNTPLKTIEAIHTDRVYVPAYEHLKAMLTGDGSQEGLSPYIAASWEDTDETFTALIVDANERRLSAQLFSHARKDRQVTVRLWQLAPGDYRVTLKDTNGLFIHDTVTLSARGERYTFSLPSQQVFIIEFERAN